MSQDYIDVNLRAEKLRRLVNVSVIMNSTLELEPLLRYIIDTAAEIVDAETASILLIDENTKQLNFMAFTSDDLTSQFTQKLKRIPVPLENSIAGAVVQKNTVIVVDDVAEYPSHYRQADATSGFQTNSLLAIPMRIRKRVIGVLEGVNKIEQQKWTDDDVYFLQILASQAAVAIENASMVSKLREAHQELSQLDKLKNDFIAIASHELRTPLGVILGYASFIKDEAQGSASSHAEAVLNSALKMRDIIEDMTNLQYLNVGTSELELETISVNELIMLTVSAGESHAQHTQHTIVHDDVSEALTVYVDKLKVVMALSAIMNNAIKFSPNNTTVHLSVEDHPTEVWLAIADQGIGISPEEYKHIFKAFYQIEEHMTRRHGGMGLGLAISKAIIDAHQGRIWVKSKGLSEGSTFYISLPKPSLDQQNLDAKTAQTAQKQQSDSLGDAKTTKNIDMPNF